MTDTYVAPLPDPHPLEGEELNDYLQQWVVGITGLAGNLVRPSFQPEPANVPTAGTAWAAIFIATAEADTYPYVGQIDDDAYLQRQEQLDMLCSFYDLGTNGLADYYAKRLRDGTAIAQNRQPLYEKSMALRDVGEVLTVPSLLKNRWLYRVDLRVSINRQVDRLYGSTTIASVRGTVTTDEPPQTRNINADIS